MYRLDSVNTLCSWKERYSKIQFKNKYILGIRRFSPDNLLIE